MTRMLCFESEMPVTSLFPAGSAGFGGWENSEVGPGLWQYVNSDRPLKPVFTPGSVDWAAPPGAVL